MTEAAAPDPIADEAISITRLFPTPLASTVHPDHVRLNRALAELILRRAAEHPGVSHSNEGGWQSADDFADWSGPAGAELCRFAQDFANRISAILLPDGRLIEADTKWTFNAWANVNRRGDANAVHGHPASYWSGTYWVDDGAGPGAEAVGGELEFLDPRGIAPSLVSPLMRMKIEGCLSAGSSHKIAPKSGTFVFFPSWLLHSVNRYLGDRPRISVAFNLLP